jgi:hypothetical protein
MSKVKYLPKGYMMIELPKRDMSVKLELDRMSVYEDYDLSSPVNAYAIKDIEAERVFRNFIQSSSYLLGENGVSRVDGREIYANYIYSSMLLSEFVQGEIDVKADRKKIPNEPVEFLDMTIDGDINDPDFIKAAWKQLEKAEREMLLTLSTYLSHKYREPFPIMFDGRYLATGFHKAGPDFKASEYDIYLAHARVTAGTIQFVSVEATPPTFYNGEVQITRPGSDTVLDSFPGTVDTIYGTVVADGLRDALDTGHKATLIVDGVKMPISRNSGAELFANFPPALSDVDTITQTHELIDHLNATQDPDHDFRITVSLLDDRGNMLGCEDATPGREKAEKEKPATLENYEVDLRAAPMPPAP